LVSCVPQLSLFICIWSISPLLSERLSMTKVNQLKRECLRGVVQENIAAFREPLQWPRRQRRQGVRLRCLVLVVVFAGLAISPSTMSTGTGSEQGVTFPAPQRVDPAVLALGIRRIVLDPGHGGHDPGAVSPLGMTEKELTLDISHRLRRLLEAALFEVVMTREEDDTVSLRQRAELANRHGGDLFLSIHVNSFDTHHQIRGVETYYLGPTDDPILIQYAALENRASGYSLTDFRRLLEGIYAHAKQDVSRQFAAALQRELFQTLHTITPALADRGVKSAPFIVLIAAQMPAILVEVSALSNEAEARLLATSEYRQSIAQALFRGIRAYADAVNHANKIGSNPWRRQAKPSS
jgi:N-acetylmuramoyl-L-alanine amidase